MTEVILQRVRDRLQSLATDVVYEHGMLVITLPRDWLLGAVRALRDELGFDLFLDVTAIDWPLREPRFDVVYHFYSTSDFVRVRLKTRVAESDLAVDTMRTLYPAAYYMERECHEMYGIEFRGNPDLRPILLYEGFVGYPLRKDYDKEHEKPLVTYRSATERERQS